MKNITEQKYNDNQETSRIHVWQTTVPDPKIHINKLSLTCIKTVTGPALSISII